MSEEKKRKRKVQPVALVVIESVDMNQDGSCELIGEIEHGL